MTAARPDPSLPADDETAEARDRGHEGKSRERGADTSASQQHKRVARLPHELDESADSQRAPAPTRVGRQAHDDLESGRQDTDRAPVADETYRQLKSGKR